MARLILFFALLVFAVIRMALWIIKTSVDRRRSPFPLVLPERPQKAAKSRFRERIAPTLHTSRAKRAKSAIVPAQLQSGSYTTASFTPSASIASDAIYSHVHTRYAPASISPGHGIRRTTASQSHGLAPRLKKAVSTLKRSNSNTRKNHIPLKTLSKDDSSAFSAPAILQSSLSIAKREPMAKNQNTFHHRSLNERLKRLKLPPKATSQFSPSAPVVPSLSPQHATSTSLLQLQAAQAVWDMVATSPHTLPDRTEAPTLPMSEHGFVHWQQIPSRAGHSTMVQVRNDSDDASNITDSNNNPYRLHMQARKRTQSSLSRRDTPIARRWRRRTRSPNAYSRTLEVNTTSSNSQQATYPDLPIFVAEAERLESSASSQHYSPRFLDSTDASILQIELDRRLAQLLQQEEEDEHLAAESLRIQWVHAAHQSPLQQPGRIAGRGRSVIATSTQSGAQDDPISLESDSDSDSDSGDLEEIVFTGRDRSRNGPMDSTEPIIVDDDDSDWESCTDLDASQATMDANLTQIIQDQENFNQRASPGFRECAVCGEQQPIAEMPSAADCEHAPQICAGCYANWTTAQLEESGWKEVKCPESKCKRMLTYHEIQNVATQETFHKFDTFITRAAISEDPNFHWCRACDAGQEHLTGEEGNIFTCHYCGHKICIKHENTWHEGETCEEYEYRSSGQKARDQKAQEEASMAAIGKLSKKCPGPNCVYNIEKNEGCDHMTCSKCRYEFCWICLREYNKIRSQGNSAHARDCKYYM